ncbi:MAG: YdbL family protein [Candidatus Dadabacteria bacterium]|nr:YdbL family protein [Candidatus Dadabacteria bacterium]NIS08738.1 YdbL family protein [Candidatus Dadabacteria bacterium]NIV42622.1 DUF1318 domain-containing protein [Candidatus Dadabacteria bacterium]NIX15424.1 DUF1318 domain-containing protein [Candidatus Dadabacteria bacterium]NIY22087.1 DUF1318 domain-containing protein [Candidatus Dadabacteria bacterium]
MKNLYNSLASRSLYVFLFLNLSCAIVTINVYFPAEEVKDVFQALEDELLEDGEQENNSDQTDAEPESMEQETATDSEPTSFIYPTESSITANKIIATKRVFRLVPEAYAQSGLTNKILNNIKSNPAVQKAYDRRNNRQSAVNKLLSKRLAGEGNKGLLVKRGSLSSSDSKTVSDENSDRNIIIKAMAEEIVKINKLDIIAENINSVKPQAAEQFAAVRIGEVRSGTLIQLPSGQWSAK